MKGFLIIVAAVFLANSSLALPPTFPGFNYIVPRNWSSSKTDDGLLRLTGPYRENGISALIVIQYVAPGDASFPNADSYIARHAQKPLFDIPGWKRGPVTTIQIARRKARTFTDDTTTYYPHASLDTKEIPLREEHVVVPATKGFYVLIYSTPRKFFADGHSAFASVLSGFKPKF